MSNARLKNGFSDLEIPVLDGGTNNATKMALDFNGVDQGAKGALGSAIGSEGALTAWVKVNDASRAETFRLKPTASGYKNLPAAITIDGTTVQPAIRLEGEDADLTSWDDTLNGNSFALAGTGSAPTFDELAPGIDCKRVKFNGGAYFKAASASVGDVGTDDFVIELILEHYSVSGADPVSKVNVSVNDSITIFAAGSTLNVYYSHPSGATINVVVATGLVDGTNYHVIIFFDRDGNLKGFCNNIASTATDISANSALNPGSAREWSIGARNSGTSNWGRGISYFALWHSSGWLSTADQAGVAAERFARCCGTYATTAQELVNPGLTDMDMEAAGTTAWTAISGATLSKQSGTRTGGSGTQVLRVQGDGATLNQRAYQDNGLNGVRRLTGWFRSDGTASPRVFINGLGLVAGSTSTDWQYFDLEIPYEALTRLDLGASGATSGYVEYDDVQLTYQGAIPETQSRSTEAYLEKWNIAETQAYLIPVGDNWIRTDKVKDQSGTLKTGLRLENSGTNLLLYSEDFSDANWTKSEATIGTAINRLGDQNFDAIVASTSSLAPHYVEQAATVTADVQSISVYATKGDVDGLKIENSSGTNQYAYFDLTNGTVGTTGAGLDSDNPAYIYDMGNGVYRCEIRYLSAGTTATARFYATDGETDNFAGDASTPSIYLFGAQLEDDADLLSSYVKTTTATATRSGDVGPYFHAYENIGATAADPTKDRLNLGVELYAPLKTTSTNPASICGIDDETVNNRISLSFLNATHQMRYFLTSGGVSQMSEVGASRDTTSFIRFDFHCATSNCRGYEEREQRVLDTSVTMPTDLKRILVGRNLDTGPLNKLITDFAISPYGLSYPRGIAQLDVDSSLDDTSAFIGYDDLTGDGTSFELRAGAGDTGLVTMNGGTLTPDTWYLVSLEWSGGTAISLKVDGVEVDSATADASLSGLTDLFLGWIALNGYTYEPSPGDEDYMITLGDVSIADVQIHNDLADGTNYTIAAWYTEMLSRGVPDRRPNLIHELASDVYGPQADYPTIYLLDIIGDNNGTITNDGGSTTRGVLPVTEVGLGVKWGGSDDNFGIAEFGSGFQFLQETSHSYHAWIRIDGSGDQVIWCNGTFNALNYQALVYDSTSEAIVYHSNIGGTARSVSAAVETGRLYAITVTRDYDSGAGTTLLTIYRDGEFVEAQTYSGAPVVTGDTMIFGAESESGGTFVKALIGRVVGSQFFDDALTSALVTSYVDDGETVIGNGPYATQTIEPTELEARLTGALAVDSGYPMLLVQAEEDGPWRAVGWADGDETWAEFEADTAVNAIQLIVKHFSAYGAQNAKFDDIDGGEASPSATIELATVDANKRKALEELVLARKPLHSWCIMIVKYT